MALRRRRELPLMWHFAITCMVVGAWGVVMSAGILAAGWDYAF